MSTLDREPRSNSTATNVYQERRVDPGANVVNPQRVSPPSKLPPAPPRVPGSQRGPIPK